MKETEIMSNFRANSKFQNIEAQWKPEIRQLFIKLAIAVHNKNMDWWFTKDAIRFGYLGSTTNSTRRIGHIPLNVNQLNIRIKN